MELYHALYITNYFIKRSIYPTYILYIMFITHSKYPTTIEANSTLRITIFDEYLTT